MRDRGVLDRLLWHPPPPPIPASTLGKSLSWELRDEQQLMGQVRASLQRASLSHRMEKVKTCGFSPRTEASGAGLLEHLQVAGGENIFFKSIPVVSVCAHTLSWVSSFVHTPPGPVLPVQTPSTLQVQPSLLPVATQPPALPCITGPATPLVLPCCPPHPSSSAWASDT